MSAITEISFARTPEEDTLIQKILDRAITLKIKGVKSQRMDYWMDLAATHANGCPMDFARMLDGDDFSFIHDFCGIARHLDRATGQLMNCFVPRFAKPQECPND